MLLSEYSKGEKKMLDAYIIDRIRQEREPQKDSRIPLQIHVPNPPPEPRKDDRSGPRQERGTDTIDYRL